MTPLKTKPQMTLKKATEIVEQLNDMGYEARFGNNDHGKISIILDTYVEILPNKFNDINKKEEQKSKW